MFAACVGSSIPLIASAVIIQRSCYLQVFIDKWDGCPAIIVAWLATSLCRADAGGSDGHQRSDCCQTG